MSAENSLGRVSLNLLYAPSKAFEALRKDGRAWFPILLLVVFNSLFYVIYFQSVDFSWSMQNAIESQASGDLSVAEKEQALKMYESMGVNAMMGLSIGSSILFIPIMLAIYGVYYLIASNIRNDKLTYGKCFVIGAWSSLISSLSIIVGIIRILASPDDQIAQTVRQGLNFNDLFFGLEPSSDWFNILNNLDPTVFWAAVLASIAYKTFAKTSTVAAFIVGFLPIVLIYGIWVVTIIT